jgi:cell division protein FtsB
MSVFAELKRRVPMIAWPLVGCVVVAYFTLHAVEGDRGLKAWQDLDLQIAAAQATLDAVTVERDALAERVARLHPTGLDTDLLEERARLVLGFVPANAVVIGNGVIPRDRTVINASFH